MLSNPLIVGEIAVDGADHVVEVAIVVRHVVIPFVAMCFREANDIQLMFAEPFVNASDANKWSTMVARRINVLGSADWTGTASCRCIAA